MSNGVENNKDLLIQFSICISKTLNIFNYYMRIEQKLINRQPMHVDCWRMSLCIVVVNANAMENKFGHSQKEQAKYTNSFGMSV